MTTTTVGTATPASGESATGRIEVTAMAGGVDFRKPMAEGDTITRIHDVFDDEVGAMHASTDGMFFGLRCLPSVMTGDLVLLLREARGHVGRVNARAAHATGRRAGCRRESTDRRMRQTDRVAS